MFFSTGSEPSGADPKSASWDKKVMNHSMLTDFCSRKSLYKAPSDLNVDEIQEGNPHGPDGPTEVQKEEMEADLDHVNSVRKYIIVFRLSGILSWKFM